MLEGMLGMQVVLDLYGCNPEKLMTVEVVADILRESAKVGNCTVVSEHFHQFEPGGVSGALFLSESHCSIHSWYEQGYAAMDIFYCSPINEEEMINSLVDLFEAKSYQIQRLNRS